jgi:hypothetical protein
MCNLLPADQIIHALFIAYERLNLLLAALNSPSIFNVCVCTLDPVHKSFLSKMQIAVMAVSVRGHLLKERLA